MSVFTDAMVAKGVDLATATKWELSLVADLDAAKAARTYTQGQIDSPQTQKQDLNKDIDLLKILLMNPGA
jgi:hypothetical protein